MPTLSRRLSAFALVALATTALAACGSSSKKSNTTSTATTSTTTAPVAVVGRSTSVLLNPATVSALKKANITITPVAPATAKKTLLVFPVNGGQVVTATLAGTVNHTGGVKISANGKSVELNNPVIDTNTKQITATVAGTTVPVFDLNLAAVRKATGPNGTVVATDVKLTTTAQASSTLNTALGTTAFKGGENFGVATLTLAVA